MRLQSIIKFGGLAFDIASDEKVQQLAGMVHSGAKRRGLLQPWMPPAQGHPHMPYPPAHWPKSSQPIPFAPSHGSPAPASHSPVKVEPAKAEPAPEEQKTAAADGLNLEKWVNMDNAKKVIGWMGTLNQMLNKQ
ncbi:hypothetical protein [Alicyclobacillus sacchari]|uniref:hypothetical protein n=1 Tax=Alicyclobacillus sacchari TaxID=392010 RepID=UPI001416FD38|nr:hypothetical protein [Alicyclobacillus sacchari]